MKLTLRVWRQQNAETPGAMATYEVDNISADMSFLEMLDTLNEELILAGDEPVAFDHDCREGICGACSLVINGDAHGPERTTTCQLHMRSFSDGDTIDIEPWRASAFPVVKDLVVDRSSFDRIIQSGGYISAPTGTAPDAHATPVPKPDADFAFEHAECIGCGACVAACPNGSAMLFTSAKVNHLNVLPQRPGARDPGAGHGGPDGRGGVRRLHADRRVRHRLPEGHPAAVDRGDEQGVAAGHAQGPPLRRELIPYGALPGAVRDQLPSARARYGAVRLPAARATSRGAPAATIRPPRSPPPGPRSITWSAPATTAMSCSTTTTVFPASTSPCNCRISTSTSAGCSPVVGSSSRYRVCPRRVRCSSDASLIRCASPPDSSVAGCPSRR